MPFIVVRYGEDKSEMFNPNCRNIILLNSIKQRCHCNDNDIIDLSDETGSICHLPSHLQEYGKNYLIDRTNYVLVKMETKMSEETEDVRVTYTPLLDGFENNKEYMERLNPRPTGKKGKLRRTASSLSGDSKGSEKRTKKTSAARKISGAISKLSAIKR